VTPRVTAPERRPSPHDLAREAARLALEKKASDCLILDLTERSEMCDYFVIASGDSEPQVSAIAERVEAGLAAMGEKPWHVEGRGGKRWVLLDYVDIVVHVFHKDTREVFLLERLWGDAPREVARD
jgi:ribosome-associated protein